MKYIFYCFYNTQYLDGKNRINKTPWFDALWLMIGGSAAWLLIIGECWYFYVLNQNVGASSWASAIIITALLFYTHFYWFIKDEKYKKIYEKYKSEGNSIGQERLISILYIFVPTLLSMLIAMLWHNVI